MIANDNSLSLYYNETYYKETNKAEEYGQKGLAYA